MKQDVIETPKVQHGSWRPILTGMRLHVGSSLLRTYVWLISGNGADFDEITWVRTPNLGSGWVRIAICRPKDKKRLDKIGKCPLLVVMEGGGFILGQPEDGQRHDRALSDSLGAVVISIDYAKSPRYPYPHALLQAFEVLTWAFSPAAQERRLNVNPAKVALMGNSAGGNLSATLSVLVSFTSGPCAEFRKRLPASFKQVLQVLLYPSIETGRPYSERFHRASGEAQMQSIPIGIAQLMEDSYLPDYIDRKQVFVQPLLVDEELLRDLVSVPALILTAGMDCLKQEADAYAERLTKAGGQVVLHDYPQAKHGFSHYKTGPDFRPDDVADCWRRIEDSLQQAFE